MSTSPFQRRQVVLLPFPFSDLSAQKLRPALLLADAGRGDWHLSQITSKPYGDPHAVPLRDADFDSGGLRIASCARPAKLFTARESLLRPAVGTLSREAHARVVSALASLLNAG